MSDIAHARLAAELAAWLSQALTAAGWVTAIGLIVVGTWLCVRSW